MNPLKASLLATALSLGLAGAGSACARSEDGGRTAGQALDDAAITAEVKAKLLADERTQGFDINVDTRNGVVTLRGGADSAEAKRIAGQLAGEAQGVVLIQNELVVAEPGTEQRQDANTATLSGEARELADETGDGVDEAWITSKVKTQLLADAEVKGTWINVETEGDVVTLTGTAETVEARARAIAIARGTKGVRAVVADQLLVRKP